jgi:hypothetical protein
MHSWARALSSLCRSELTGCVMAHPTRRIEATLGNASRDFMARLHLGQRCAPFEGRAPLPRRAQCSHISANAARFTPTQPSPGTTPIASVVRSAGGTLSGPPGPDRPPRAAARPTCPSTSNARRLLGHRLRDPLIACPLSRMLPGFAAPQFRRGNVEGNRSARSEDHLLTVVESATYPRSPHARDEQVDPRDPGVGGGRLCGKRVGSAGQVGQPRLPVSAQAGRN